MPEIAPFRGLRYSVDRFKQDQSNLVAPPYDVLDEDDKAGLIARNDRNVVRIDLPHVPPKTAGPDAVYAEAADVLARWRQDGTLMREPRPAIYVYHQDYAHAGRTFTRRMLLARMRLERFGSGKVFPHEQTFGGPKEDRLKLMQATRCQLSPVFGLYTDPDGNVACQLDIGNGSPDVIAELENVTNRLWVVDEEKVIRRVCETLAERPVYIADGHHRYGTALTYRDGLGDLPDDHPARFVLVGLCAMEDPGCVILPTHRVITDFDPLKPAEILAALQPGLKTVTASPCLTDPAQLLPPNAHHDVGIYVAAGDRMYTGTFKNRAILDEIAPDHSPAWRSLDLAYLHRYLIDDLITRRALGGKAPRVHCVKSLDETMKMARSRNGIAIICKACSMTELREVSQAGDLMPQKSTFFYPKLATGLVLNPLE